MLVAGITKKSVVTINPLATVREALMKGRGVKSLFVEKRHSDTDVVGSLIERAANEK
ncbi:MAG: hypothetical protein AW10_01706 [Candidatus Accumulibacter appositus]|uniref:Uncharacterized protein n=1 Tax=Candidatus Accumulibacter appositus TaxID=1454003 RepID=A0A011ND15_9PROT|nr:hypothetical protein [Accumulibacter sp.]EXI80563.1 MAG: hypothetical protein AW10_01706 [Candidatus Accumulibacter appositus]HRF03653.1 hypothetical protein [Accumulibacter sp.]